MLSAHWLPRINLIRFMKFNFLWKLQIATLLCNKGYNNTLEEIYTSVGITFTHKKLKRQKLKTHDAYFHKYSLQIQGLSS